MDDIRLFETDGDYLVLEAQDGQKFRLLIDESVRSSVKRESQPRLDSISITPREIQEEIRNGATIQDLIQRSGASFDFIEKFAAPVIAELDHIVSSALSVRLTIAGDRYNDSSQIEFGEIISGRLVTSGASGISWIAKKLEPNNWHVIAHYQLNGVSGSATWSFDPRKLTLSPESETAVTLSSQETLSDGPIPKLRTVDLVQQNLIQETVVLDEVISFPRFDTPVAVQEFEPSTPAAFKKSESTAQDSSEPLSATADLLEALRRKRTEREETQLAPHPEPNNIRVIDFDPAESSADSPSDQTVGETEESKADETQGAETSEQPKSAKKGRAAMPSWDEIVFGTKADD